MKMNDYHYLGYISKTIGFEGSLLVFFEAVDPSVFQNIEVLFILIDGKPVPFFIEEISFRVPARQAIVAFNDITSTDKARHLCARKIYLPASILPEYVRKKNEHESLIGFAALAPNGKQIGTIADLLEYPGNPVFSILKDDNEILIPAADDLILNINHDRKTITLNPPDGLLDLYR